MSALPATWPLPLGAYAAPEGSLGAVLADRIARDPFNLAATLLFLGAIAHTFAAPAFRAWADRRARRDPESFAAEALHFLGEVEVVFGLWAVPLLLLAACAKGGGAVLDYLERQVSFTEPLFIVAVMTMASSRPILGLAARALGLCGARSPAGWWLALVGLGPLLGSLVTEPAAMTICALLLAKEFYRFHPRPALAYATLGLLFVNVSVGGTLSHFAAPPVLMVAEKWGWGWGDMLVRFGGKAALGIGLSTALYYACFRRELAALGRSRKAAAPDEGPAERPVPRWIAAVHVAFLAAAVAASHHPVLFVGAFLFFLAFVRATRPHQDRLDLRAPVLVGFFLAGLVVHGGLQGWWIEPVLGRLGEAPLLLGAAFLTAFNDNAAITYLATLVPGLKETLRYAVVAGAVAGGGLTVIANAPNPAGQAILGRFFPRGVSPAKLALGAAAPTAILLLVFWLLR